MNVHELVSSTHSAPCARSGTSRETGFHAAPRSALCSSVSARSPRALLLGLGMLGLVGMCFRR
eukprot:668117-Pyramimonas_sp.AAC.1